MPIQNTYYIPSTCPFPHFFFVSTMNVNNGSLVGRLSFENIMLLEESVYSILSSTTLTSPIVAQMLDKTCCFGYFSRSFIVGCPIIRQEQWLCC